MIPFPKYDSAQENYGSSTRSTFSGLGIPKCGNAEFADLILEAFSSESYRTVSPAYYEIAMKDKYSRDSVSAQMYDMIKAGVRYDFAIINAQIMADVNPTILTRRQICRELDNWISTWEASEKVFTTNIEAYFDDILALEE